MKTLFGFLGLILTAVLSRSAQGADFPEDCSEIWNQSPRPTSGVYIIQPRGSKTRLRVYCEMHQFDAWIVIQRRTFRVVPFDKPWAEYRDGFGSLTSDHWLGLEKMHMLTKDTKKVWTLRVDLYEYKGGNAFAEYRDFRVGDEGTDYRLHVGTYRGNAGDAIRGANPAFDQNGAGFSTKDRDNTDCFPCTREGVVVESCTRHSGGWWYSRCGSATLNAEWLLLDYTPKWRSGLYWATWMRDPYAAKVSTMMIKPD